MCACRAYVSRLADETWRHGYSSNVTANASIMRSRDGAGLTSKQFSACASLNRYPHHSGNSAIGRQMSAAGPVMWALSTSVRPLHQQRDDGNADGNPDHQTAPRRRIVNTCYRKWCPAQLRIDATGAPLIGALVAMVVNCAARLRQRVRISFMRVNHGDIVTAQLKPALFCLF